MNILVSACLLGIKCRYDGGTTMNDDVLKLAKQHTLIPVCPEQLGGLSTPRVPAERMGNKVITKAGNDVTEAFKYGAEATLQIAKIGQCEFAILKERSPSCGNCKIYDGTFSDNLIPGKGLCAELLEDSGIKVYGESEIINL